MICCVMERLSSLWGDINSIFSAWPPLLWFLSLFSLSFGFASSTPFLPPASLSNIFLHSTYSVSSLLLAFSLCGSDCSAAPLNAVPSGAEVLHLSSIRAASEQLCCDSLRHIQKRWQAPSPANPEQQDSGNDLVGRQWQGCTLCGFFERAWI